MKLLLILSALALVAGFLFMSEATTGVGIIAAAGVLAVYARIDQAGKHHAQVLEKLEQGGDQSADGS